MTAPVADIETGELHPVPRQSQGGSCCGRLFKDWSQPVMLTVLGVSAVGVGFGYGLQEPLYTAGAVVLLAADLIFGCARITCLKPKKDLENQLKDYQSQNQKLTSAIADLKQTKEDLNHALESAEVSVADLKKTLKDKVSNLAAIADQLKATEEKLEILKELYHKYKYTTKAFAKDLNELKSTSKVAGQRIGKLGEHVNDLDITEDELSEEIDQYADVTKYQSEKNEDLRKMLEGMKGDFKGMQSRFEAMQLALTELKQHVTKIDESDDKFRDGAADFNKGSEALNDKVLPKLEDIMKRLELEVEKLAEDSSEESKS